jgi:hypothetical protein
LINAVVKLSLSPGSPKPLWSSNSGIAIVFKCFGTDEPEKEYAQPDKKIKNEKLKIKSVK